MLCASPNVQRKNKKPPATGTTAGQNIKVFVRVRPMNENEKLNKSYSVVQCPTSREVVVQERPLDKHTKKFSFDRAFDGKSKQTDIYKSVAKPLVEEVLNGFNCTIFAYGQTGTGKTFTMEGDHFGEGTALEDNNAAAGIIPRCVNQLFDELRIQKLEFTMRVSFLELYNEELFDLLSAHDDLSKLRLFEDCTRKGSCIIQGLEEVLVRSKSDVYSIISKGSAKRQTAATLMNAHSSRSHTVFTVTVHIKENNLEGDELLKTGKLHLVDLAGSENIGRSGAVDKRAREAGNINQSLLTLGRVITSLVEKAPHVPYRESKLTRLLQDALGGRTKTSIIATISPASVNLEETLSTLDYAHRAKNIQNKPEVNQKLNKKELICEYTNEIEKLRRDLLAMREKSGGVYLANENYEEMISTMQQQAQEISQKITEIRTLEGELEKQIDIFTNTQNELQVTSEKLHATESSLSKTKEVLECTQNLLSQTALERDEQEHLVSAHVKTEKEFHTQGKNLINVVQTTTNDIDKLHDKLDRKRKVEALNEDIGKAFEKEFEDRVSSMHCSVVAFKEYHQRNTASVMEIMDDYLNSKQENLTKMKDQVKTMNTSVVNSLGECYKNFKQKIDEGKVKSCATSDGVVDKVEMEKQLLKGFLEEFVQPFFKRISDLQLDQVEAVQRQEENMRSKAEAMTHLCHTLHEEQSVLLTSMETRLVELAEFPTIFASEIKKKSDFLEEKTKAHSQELRKITNQFLAKIDAQDQLLADQFPILTSAQEDSLLQSKHSTEKLLKQVSELSALSSRHKNESLEHNEDLKTTLVEDSAKILSQSTESQEQLSSLKEKLEERTSCTCATLDELLKMARHAKEETAKDATAIQDALKDEVQAISGVVSDHCETSQRDLSSSKENTETAVSELKEKVVRSESELEEFLTDHMDQLRESGECVQSLLTEQLAKDAPTGETPIRREYSYPRSLVVTSPHERLLRRYRSRNYAATKIPLPTFKVDAEDDTPTDVDSSSSTINSDLSGLLDSERNISSGFIIEPDLGAPVSRSASFKDSQSIFTVPATPLRQESKDELSKQNSSSLSRSSSTSSLGDSKENINGNSRRLASTKKRELKQPTSVSSASDVHQTRSRKILGSFN